MMKNIPDIVIKKKIDTWNIIVNNVKKIYISFYNKIILFLTNCIFLEELKLNAEIKFKFKHLSLNYE